MSKRLIIFENDDGKIISLFAEVIREDDNGITYKPEGSNEWDEIFIPWGKIRKTKKPRDK